MTEKATRGEPMCHPALGYDLINKQYVPNAEAPYIREIFEAYLNGAGQWQIAKNMALKGLRTHRGNPPDNRLIDYILHNPVYIGKIRWSTDGRAASKRDYDNENIMIVDGKHEPLIDIDTWNRTQELLLENKSKYGAYQRREQPVQFMLKGLVRCSCCGATLTMLSTKCPSMQCHNYSRGSCQTSHSLSIAKANKAVIEALEEDCGSMSFNIEPADVNTTKPLIDYDKLIAAEENKLKKAKQAYLSEIDTLEEYKQNKADIIDTIERLRLEQKKQQPAAVEFDNTFFANRVEKVLDYIKSPDASEQAKNEALRSVISKIIYNKAQGCLDIFYYQ